MNDLQRDAVAFSQAVSHVDDSQTALAQHADDLKRIAEPASRAEEEADVMAMPPPD